jgi:hypothetical protein
MLTVQEIERAISQLPFDDLARFREWFDGFDAKAWDKQFEVDAKSGKLDKLSNQAVILTNTAVDPIAKIPELKVCAVRVERRRQGDKEQGAGESVCPAPFRIIKHIFCLLK